MNSYDSSSSSSEGSPEPSDQTTIAPGGLNQAFDPPSHGDDTSSDQNSHTGPIGHASANDQAAQTHSEDHGGHDIQQQSVGDYSDPDNDSSDDDNSNNDNSSHHTVHSHSRHHSDDNGAYDDTETESEDDEDDHSVQATILEDDDDDDSEASQEDSWEELMDKYKKLMTKYSSLHATYHQRWARYRDKVRTLLQEKRALRAQVVEKDREITEKEREIQELKDRRNGINPRPIPWRTLLRLLLQGTPHNKFRKYERVYREMCRQENMSQKPDHNHPGLTFANRVRPKKKIRKAYLSAPAPNHPPNGAGDDAAAEINDTPGGNEEQPDRFNELPRDIQLRILTLVFVKRGITHCITRLDRANPPPVQIFTENHYRQDPLLHRFWFSKSPCSVTRAYKPSDVLRPLLVSRRWLYIGIHAFYGYNTFAFSSLGEMGAFLKGIGPARRARIQNLELFWHGSLNPRHPTKVSQRSLPLAYLTRMNRLSTFVIHINEVEEKRMRRKYELQDKTDRLQDYQDVDINTLTCRDTRTGKIKPEAYKSLKKRTFLQPNFRDYRSMRTVQGIDYVYSLRGMRYIRVYEAQSRERENIQDWSFIDDINSVVTMPKPTQYAMESELDNLPDVIRDMDFSDADKDLAYSFYRDDPIIAAAVATMNDDDDAESDDSDNDSAIDDIGLDSDSDSGSDPSGGDQDEPAHDFDADSAVSDLEYVKEEDEDNKNDAMSIDSSIDSDDEDDQGAGDSQQPPTTGLFRAVPD